MPVAGRVSGRVIERKIFQLLAPSTLAASKYSCGIATMPGHEDQGRDADTLPDVDARHAQKRQLRVGEPAGPGDAEEAEEAVDHAVERVEQRLEGEADADGRHQHREEDDGAQVAAADDRRGQQQRERESEDDLRAPR